MDPKLIILIVFVAVIIVVIALYFYFINKTAKLILKSYLGIRYDDNNTLHYFRHTDFENMEQEKFTFKSNGLELMGFKYENKTIEWNNEVIVFVHGLGVGHIQYTTEINHFVNQGYKVYTFDGQGCNESKGDGILNFTNYIKNANDFIKHCEVYRDFKNRKFSLVGHSLGGHTVLVLEKMNEDKIKNVVSMAPFNDLETLIRDQVGTTVPRLANKIAKAIARIEKKHLARYYLSAANVLKDTNVDTLIIFGDKDHLVNYQNNYVYLKETLKDKDNVYFATAKNRTHRPNLSLRAAEYDTYRIMQYNEIKNGTPEDIAKHYNELDYNLLVEMDNDVMNLVDSFIKGDKPSEKERFFE